MRQERLLPHEPTKRTSSHVAHLRLRSHLSNGVSESDRINSAFRLLQSASISCITARILADWPLVLFPGALSSTDSAVGTVHNAIRRTRTFTELLLHQPLKLARLPVPP